MTRREVSAEAVKRKSSSHGVLATAAICGRGEGGEEQAKQFPFPCKVGIGAFIKLCLGGEASRAFSEVASLLALPSYRVLCQATAGHS